VRDHRVRLGCPIRAREWERDSRKKGDRGGIIGYVGMRILDVLLFHFLDRKTGRLDPSYEQIARIAACGRSAVAEALQRLRKLGLINWVRRCSQKIVDGRYTLEQDTNAYAVLPPSQWRFFTPRHTTPPKPEPGTWGDHTPLPDLMTQAEVDRRQGGSIKAALDILELDPLGDPVAAAIARLFRAVKPSESEPFTGDRNPLICDDRGVVDIGTNIPIMFSWCAMEPHQPTTLASPVPGAARIRR
jgi:hypothetical protein